MLDSILDWITANSHWLFSGIGVFVLSCLAWLFRSKRSLQKQSSGPNSVNIQAGGDVKIDGSER